MLRNRQKRSAVSLVEVMIAMAILSTLALPMGMFLVEQMRGSSQLGDYYQILNLLEEKLETALEMRFHDIPVGDIRDVLVESEGHRGLDLRPAEVARNIVSFRMSCELLPVSFAALKDAASSELQTFVAEDGMKRIEIFAEWGDKRKHRLNLVAYRANL
jgi:prepilin-type N-terminal cleavage/methylation domain-containing protein